MKITYCFNAVFDPRFPDALWRGRKSWYGRKRKWVRSHPRAPFYTLYIQNILDSRPCNGL